MAVHIVPLDEKNLEVFMSSGALNIKSYRSTIKLDDSIVLHCVDYSLYIGPFAVENDMIGVYHGNDRAWQVLCRMETAVHISADPDDCKEIPCDSNDRFTPITGSRELDGLLYNADYDVKRSKYHVKFEKDVGPLSEHYAKLLNQNGIPARVLNRRFLYIEDREACEKCKSKAHFEDDDFITGFIAPRIYLIRAKPGRDAPPDLIMFRCIRNCPDDLESGFTYDSKLVFNSIRNECVSLSPMCLKSHPMNSILFPESGNEHDLRTHRTNDADEMRFTSSVSLIDEMFQMCGYTTSLNYISESCRHIVLRMDGRAFDFILVPTMSEILPDIMGDDSIPIDSFVLCTNDPSPRMRIIKWGDAIERNEDASSFDARCIALDGCDAVPMESALVREMKTKLDMLWSI